MSGAQEQSSAVVAYRLLRELGRRSQRTHAAVRADGANSLVVINRFERNAPLAGASVSGEAMAVLLRDARCLARNWHPNIARVRHVDLSGDTLWIATEMLDGVTLEDLIERARARGEGEALSRPVFARIFLDVLSGLQALHGLRDGINAPLDTFHGELCPSNVVVGRDGVARLIDVFRPRPVRVGPASEALGYASPEALAGEAGQDARADLYAVGVMLWEALMERRLYDDRDPARIVQRQREEDVIHPASRLGAVAMKAIAFDPLVRWRSASEMAARLRAHAGMIAAGSAVAQIVQDLAGERIRARRAELHPGASGQRPAVQPPAAPTRSGSMPRVSIAANNVVEEHIPPSSVMSFTKLAPILEGSFTPRPPSAAPTATTKTPSRDAADPSSLAPTPLAPPVTSRKTPSQGTTPPGRVRRLTPRELRVPSPSDSDLDTSYAPRPKAPPLEFRPLPATIPHATPDDDLPGPRSSAPEAPPSKPDELGSADLITEELGSGDLLDAGEALAAAREISLSRQSLTPPDASSPLPARWGPPPLATSAHQPPSFSSIDQLTASLAAGPSASATASATSTSSSSPPRSAPPPTDLASPARRERSALPLIAGIAVLAIGLLLAGAAVIARRSGAPGPAPTTPAVEGPSTVVVPPPPVSTR